MIDWVSVQRVPDAPHVARLRVRLRDGALTTVHVAGHDRQATTVRLARLAPPRPVGEWAAAHRIAEAMSGGFFVKPEHIPLGELRVATVPPDYRAFARPWASIRGCLWLGARGPMIAARTAVAPEDGDALLQAGPLLVSDGRCEVDVGDPEGFSTTADEFDQDITEGRLPRIAVGLNDDAWLCVAVDGRAEDDAGLSLVEFAELLVALGATSALNLDGGSSAALVAAGRVRNTPRRDDGTVLPAAGPTTTALAFEPRTGPSSR